MYISTFKLISRNKSADLFIDIMFLLKSLQQMSNQTPYHHHLFSKLRNLVFFPKYDFCIILRDVFSKTIILNKHFLKRIIPHPLPRATDGTAGVRGRRVGEWALHLT